MLEIDDSARLRYEQKWRIAAPALLTYLVKMLNYVTVFDPSRSSGEDDLHKQLLLYHSFEGSEISLNDKLGRIGMIQGIWSLTESLTDVKQDNERVIELYGEQLLVIRVESRYFLSLCISNDDEDSISSSIPQELYLSYLWYSYEFFKLHYGSFRNFEDSRKLTDLLNEQIVPFWRDIMLKPEAIIRRGITGLWPDSCKMAEMDFETSEESWESIINQSILLESESYMGIKDVLVYHLPNYNNKRTSEKVTKLGYKTLGLVRRFSNDLTMVTQLSNWIYHMHAVYDDLSSHVLAGNAHYKEVPAETEIHQEISNNQGDSSSTSGVVSDGQETLNEQGNMLLHNLTLPISFAYDAVHEVGSTTGISNSISFLMGYVPRWGRSGEENGRHSGTDYQNLKRSRYGYLISPLCSKSLPMSYKIKEVVSEEEDGSVKSYNLLFWYYDDILVVIVCEPNFSKIWESQYLEDLSYKLCTGIERFYETAFELPISSEKRSQKKESVAYIVYNEKSKQITSSVPTWFDSETADDDVSPLTLVINGVDQFFGGNANTVRETDSHAHNIWGIDIMGGLFGFDNGTNDHNLSMKQECKLDRKYQNFLEGMTQEKLWELQLQVLQFLLSLRNSAKAKDIVEERLLKLNNGVLCYIKKNEDGISVIIKNWFDSDDSMDGLSLLST